MSVTVILIIITVGISLYAWQNQDLMHKWIFQPYAVQRDNSWYRFITSGFLHADYMHLFFNMFTFYYFGRYTEFTLVREYGFVTGELLFLLIYLGGIIISDLPTFFKHRDNPVYRALGASGGVAAVLFACIYFDPLLSIGLIFIPIGIPGFIFGILYMIYSYTSSKRMGDNINHDAHFYGALYGFVLSLILIPSLLPNFFERIISWRMF